MLFGINGATTQKCSLTEDIVIAGKAGYALVELRKDKMESYLAKNTFTDLINLLRNNRVRPFTINAIGMSTMQNPAGEAKVLKMTEDFAKSAASIACPWIVACPGGKTPKTSWDEIIVKSAKTFGKMADIAWKYRINLSFEFLGFAWSSVQTVSEAWAVVQAANRGNTGITLDAAHFYSGNSSLAEISTLPREAIAVFHVNDLVNKPKAKIGDYDRVMPGDGVIPLKSIVTELNRIGFDGVASLEIFNHDFNKKDPLLIAQTGLKKMKAVVK
ncbi:MAG: sugar phosphate isomerase/epimerase [Planctomycetota bacterium]|jgi:2-keto-myo-inositol isomerase|nr:sugar phosphate isomerase/epimerase [Planctomycetota bacterium]